MRPPLAVPSRVRWSAATTAAFLMVLTLVPPHMAVAATNGEPVLAAPAAGPTRAHTAAPRGWRREMLARVNGVRAAVGAPALHACSALRRSAQGYAALMASTDTYGHVGPDGSAPWDRMRSQGYRWRAAAENIAGGQVTVAEVMTAWIQSPAHYADLVNPAYRHVGFGYAVRPGTEYGTYWVQNFGRGGGC